MCVFVCRFGCLRVVVCVCWRVMCLRVFVCLFVCWCVFVCVCVLFGRLFVCLFVRVCVFACVCAHSLVCVRVNVFDCLFA